MTLEPEIVEVDLAASALDDIALMERRTREAISYSHAAAYLVWWGSLTGIAYVIEQFRPDLAPVMWPIVIVIGVLGRAGMVMAGRRFTRNPRRESKIAQRVMWGMMALIGFGALWTVLLRPVQGRLLDLFWPTLFMMGVVLLGIWLGRFLILCGLAVAALAVAGYFWAGPWFHLWMAVVDGGGLIAAGLWLRRYGVSR